MAKRRRMFTAAESAEVWDRWQRGEALNLIGRRLRPVVGSDFPAAEAVRRDPTGTPTTIAARAEQIANKDLTRVRSPHRNYC